MGRRVGRKARFQRLRTGSDQRFESFSLAARKRRALNWLGGRTAERGTRCRRRTASTVEEIQLQLSGVVGPGREDRKDNVPYIVSFSHRVCASGTFENSLVVHRAQMTCRNISGRDAAELHTNLIETVLCLRHGGKEKPVASIKEKPAYRLGQSAYHTGLPRVDETSCNTKSEKSSL